ncbi:hypothetical protein FRC08_006093 [Ceratobasidium sp. 394]|nr:hypothetical protein FRC08_006093 [Ceratobasidium sp. 394]
MQSPDILTAIRVHKRQSDRNIPFDPSPVCAAVKRALEYSTSVVLAVSLPQNDLRALLAGLPENTLLYDDEHADGNFKGVTRRVHVFPFTSVTYGRFIPALNAIVAFAHTLEFKLVLFQSVEVHVGPEHVKRMANLCEDDVLVVGKAFDAHSFGSPSSGTGQGLVSVPLTGRTCPWNTFAIWGVSKLARTGFLLTSETNTPPNASAIEEAPTIALHQRLFPRQSRALLVRFEAVDAGEKDGWGTTWEDPARTEWHARKLASKDISAASHIANIGLAGSTTTVEHVQLS